MKGKASGIKTGYKREIALEDLLFAFFVLMILAFNCLLMLHHESWRDEAQAWLMADNLSLTRLFGELSYEGHPCLWFLVLMPLARAGLSYAAVKAVSTLLVSVSALLIAIFAPFSRLSKVFILLSPAVIYAFSAIGRVYALCAVLMILLALTDRERFEHPFLYGLILALMVQTHVVMIGFVFALCAAWFFGTLAVFRRDGEGGGLVKRLFAMLLPLGSALFLLYELRDVRNAASAGAKVSEAARITDGLSLLRGLLEQARICSNLLFGDFKPLVLILLGLFVLLALILDLHFFRQVFVLILGAGFQFFIYANIWGVANQRQYLLLYMLIWAVWTMPEREENWEGLWKVLYLAGNALLICASFASICMGLPEAMDDYRRVYSDAGECAAYLESLPETAPVFEGSGEFCNSVIANLKDRKVYSAFYESEATYTIRDLSRIRNLSAEEYLETARGMFPDAEEIYVFYYKGCPEGCMGNAQGMPETYETVYESPGGTISGEEFSVIKVPLGAKGGEQ
ncbi:MAG: hypothetical protein K6E30_09510 [Lachnospiraceae bacterium]|nr:hypothetical protein [Lachnospiraceae bacterium]